MQVYHIGEVRNEPLETISLNLNNLGSRGDKSYMAYWKRVYVLVINTIFASSTTEIVYFDTKNSVNHYLLPYYGSHH